MESSLLDRGCWGGSLDETHVYGDRSTPATRLEDPSDGPSTTYPVRPLPHHTSMIRELDTYYGRGITPATILHTPGPWEL